MSTPTPDPSADDGWQATRAETIAATQIQPSEEDYLASEARDIGRQVSGNQRELFVSCNPAEAMQQQFDHLQPEFIAIHDVGTTSSRKLLAGVAAASGRSVQKLLIRRQGFGTALATLEFIDFPSGGNTTLRIYTTEADADTTSRQDLARVLLSYSRLGVLMVGDMPPHLLSSSFDTLREAMITNQWHNRHMLLLPLATSAALSSHGTELGRGTGVTVRTTPQVTRPADAWSFISGTWNRLREQMNPQAADGMGSLPGSQPRAAYPASSASAAAAPAPATPPRASAPMPLADPVVMKPMPTVRSAESRAADTPLHRYVNQLIEMTGMVSVAVFDLASGQDVLHAGSRPSAEDLSQHGAKLLGAMSTASRAMGLGHALPEAAITLGAHHLLLRAVPHHAGLALHCVLDKTHANLTLARLQIGRMDALLDPTAS